MKKIFISFLFLVSVTTVFSQVNFYRNIKSGMSETTFTQECRTDPELIFFKEGQYQRVKTTYAGTEFTLAPNFVQDKLWTLNFISTLEIVGSNAPSKLSAIVNTIGAEFRTKFGDPVIAKTVSLSSIVSEEMSLSRRFEAMNTVAEIYIYNGFTGYKVILKIIDPSMNQVSQ